MQLIFFRRFGLFISLQIKQKYSPAIACSFLIAKLMGDDFACFIYHGIIGFDSVKIPRGKIRQSLHLSTSIQFEFVDIKLVFISFIHRLMTITFNNHKITAWKNAFCFIVAFGEIRVLFCLFGVEVKPKDLRIKILVSFVSPIMGVNQFLVEWRPKVLGF